MYQYPHLEKFYRDNYSKLLDRSSSLRPSKSVPKNGAAGVEKFIDFYKKTGLQSFSEDEVLKILNAEKVEDGDTIFHQNLRVMRELNFVSISDGNDKKYLFTDEFFSFVESNHTIDCYIIEKLMSISSVEDLTMYFNFLICVMREAAIHGQVIQYGDSADKFTMDVDDDNKRKEHQNRIFEIYGFKGDEARTAPPNYTPNISYFCHAVLRQLGILVKSKEKIDNMGTLVLTPLGELILKKIDENLYYGQATSLNSVRTISVSKYLEHSLQQIFYGAPGTGKSNTIKRKVDDNGKINFRVTFHPDSDYSTFVGCYKPTMKENIISKNNVEIKEEQIVYRFVPQAFAKAYTTAWNTEEDVFLIIEEINRGNCAQIFGDLFQLLDRGNDGFSEYPVDADTDLGNYIAKGLADSTRKDFPVGVKEGKKLVLPKNLYIWATMNTSDQSLFPIDSAFKRRWGWKYMKIKNEGKEWKIDVKIKDADGVENLVDWWKFIQKINEIIASMTSSADKQLGYFFCKADKKTSERESEPNSENNLISDNKFVSKVLFYLWNDVFKDYGFEDSSLFTFKEQINGTEETKELTFPDFYDEDGEKVNTKRLTDFVQKVMDWKKSADTKDNQD